MKNILSEDDAFLALSWISDTCDQSIWKNVTNFGAFETLKLINASQVTNAFEKRRKLRLSSLSSMNLKKIGSEFRIKSLLLNF